MKIFAACMECQKELGHPSFEPFLVPYYDDRITYVDCSRGHRSAILVQSQKFEVLMESGASALAAGFTLEAAASFSAALERFFEFCLQVICVHRELDPEVYESMFKEMARHSERQVGAFLVLFALQFGRAYRPKKQISEFRNSIIHKGLIPTPKEAERFCAQVYSEVHAVFDELKLPLASAVQRVVMEDLRRRAALLDPGIPRATAAGFGVFNICHAEQKPTFEEAFRMFREGQESLAAAIPHMRAVHARLVSGRG